MGSIPSIGPARTRQLAKQMVATTDARLAVVMPNAGNLDLSMQMNIAAHFQFLPRVFIVITNTHTSDSLS